jgi:hypothetical protein
VELEALASSSKKDIKMSKKELTECRIGDNIHSVRGPQSLPMKGENRK